MSTEVKESNGIWVIGKDYHSEGKDIPEIAFNFKSDAEQMMKILNDSCSSYYVSFVPLWKQYDE